MGSTLCGRDDVRHAPVTSDILSGMKYAVPIPHPAVHDTTAESEISTEIASVVPWLGIIRVLFAL